MIYLLQFVKKGLNEYRENQTRIKNWKKFRPHRILFRASLVPSGTLRVINVTHKYIGDENYEQ